MDEVILEYAERAGMPAKDALRLALATYFLAQMIHVGGNKTDKVRAAFEYAELIMKG